MKSITIAGNVGKDAETRSTQSGDKVTSWTVAVEGRSGKEKTTLWFKCSLWGKRGETLAQYLTKGSKVAVAGDLDQELYDGKTYLTIRAEQVTLLGSKQGGDAESPQGRHAIPPASKTIDIDDDLPF